MDDVAWVHTLVFPPGLETMNSNHRRNRYEANRLTQMWKGTAITLARAARIPRLERTFVVSEFRPPRQGTRDAANLYPTVKACLDGIVVAGVLADDSQTYVQGPFPKLGLVFKDRVRDPLKRGQMLIHLHPWRDDMTHVTPL
ncbi:hypothetical protein [Streptosporangium sp. NPDC002524]|uniref:hypothetical protein n=1 Tax=Streptosporangium sp. NPDC002524 TaxID=3154537 RepID=UPI00332D2418